MDTLYNIPNVKFITQYLNPKRQIENSIGIYYTSQNEMLSIYRPSIKIKEFDTIYILFEDEDNTARLYLEGLELMPEQYVLIDEEGLPYWQPSSKKYPLYSYDNEFYGIRVGKYELHIKYEDREYFALVEVVPQHLTMNEWDLLKDDLERELKGLAQDLIRKNIGLDDYALSTIPVEKFYKFLVIRNYSESIIGSLIDLKDRPNYKVVKEYKQMELSRSKEIDKVTIKSYLVKGAEKDSYLVPNRVISYDIQENRWLRRIIDFYESELDTFTKLVSESKKIIEKEITSLKLYQNIKSNQLEINSKLLLINQLESYEMVTQKILKISNIVKSQSWYHEISQLNDGYIPHVLVMDTRYSLMYKLYQELNNNEFQIRLDSEYSYAWKLTNKLYEIWCYIRICRMLMGENVNFRAKEWIFDNKKNTFLVPMLMPGTCMEFTRDNCLLKLYYDARIPRNSNKTNLENNPIYTVESHNRPDARLDIYLDGIYMRSIIFDFKYRTIRNFWYRNNSTSYSQIISYRHNTISKFTQGYPQKIAREIRPVSEVWVFHPTGENENIDQKIEKTDEGIKLIRLKPGEDHSNIAIELNSLIERIIGVGE